MISSNHVDSGIADILGPMFIGFESVKPAIHQAIHPDHETTLLSKYPLYSVYETPGHFVVEIAVAGFADTDLSVTHKTVGVIEVQGNRARPLSDVLYNGLGLYSFRKVFYLGRGASEDGIMAELKNGLLTIAIKKKFNVVVAVTDIPIQTN